MAEHVSIVAAKYGLIVVAVSIVTATCLLKDLLCDYKCVLLNQSSAIFNFPLAQVC